MNTPKILLAAALLAAVYSMPAVAADMRPTAQPVYKAAPVPVAYNWSGLYITGYFDYSANITNGVVSSPAGAITLDVGAIPHGPGVGGGLEALYQGQGSPWVVGARAEIGYMDLSSTGTLSAGGVPVLSLSNATNYLGNFNAILGYTPGDRFLVYTTGGLAFGGAKPNLAAAGICLGGGSCSTATSDTSVGWDIGAGARYALTQQLDLGIEGLYSKLGGKSLTLTGAGGIPIATSSTPYDIFTQKVTLSYKLN